ncbi:MAG: UDP-N-acetylglucosamine--N-acetylmuramyl-(pentapeptide) pyrophosphoryl-undecaprenol N-acetylglucosamine transferase [Ruminococcus sp.]|nr:UDP-N-acetylglucosamine--N-acetylmuramyl-(pentapeptide) pyrophosphoryl-undecaprenol N-acetylglucosamine transferase [Candidatus Apopatosoma intestinale]
MKILLSGGGTAGHVNPALAIADWFRENVPDAEILFVGTGHGIENKLTEKAGYPIAHIEMTGLSRKNPFANVKTAYYVLTAPHAAKKLLMREQPDLVIGTGGYVCWPLLSTAAKKGIPTALHESNAIPGKAVRMLAPYVDRIYVNFASAGDRLAENERTARRLRSRPGATLRDKIAVVGNPVRAIPASVAPSATSATSATSAPSTTSVASSTASGASSTASVAALRDSLSIPRTAKKILLSFGGSLGSQAINDAVLGLMESYSALHPDLYHIHVTGRAGYAATKAALEAKGLAGKPNLRLCEYLYDMPCYERLASAVICRSGAMTVTEMALLGKPCILIPSPNVVENHQYENARRLADADAAVLIEEKDLTPSLLQKRVEEVLDDRRASALSRNIRPFARENAAELIGRDLGELLKAKQTGKSHEKTK